MKYIQFTSTNYIEKNQMSGDTNSDKYKNIIAICNYKLSIATQMNWYFDIDNVDYYKRKWKNINELYNCHKIVFNNNKLYPPLNWIADDITQEFTIHHFIYYIIKEVRIIKHNYEHLTKVQRDIIYLTLKTNIKLAYEIHLDTLINNIYDYLYPTANIKILSNIFLIFKSISKNLYMFDTAIMDIIKNYGTFTMWSEYDLLYKLIDYIETLECENSSIIVIIYHQIIQNIKDNKHTMNDVIELIRTYEQVRTQERLKIYEEELIIKTWHPNRLMDWCLDIKEKMDHIE